MAVDPRHEAFLTLLEAHQKILYKVAFVYCAQPDDRQDLVQEMIVQRWHSFGRYDPRYRFSTWMYRIAVKTAISLARSSRRRQQPLVPLDAKLPAEVIITIPVLLLLGSFLAAHIGEPRFFVPALLLQLFAIVQLALHTHKLVVLRSLDYNEPVVSMQKRLAGLRVRWLRQLVWLYACLPLLWPPLLIVAMQGLLGLDAYTLLGFPYLAVNLLVGLACVPLALWLARALAPRVAHVPALRRLIDDLTGRSLREALDALDAATAFEREPGAER